MRLYHIYSEYSHIIYHLAFVEQKTWLVIAGICECSGSPHPRNRALKAAAKQLDMEEEAKERALLLGPAMALQNSGVHVLKNKNWRQFKHQHLGFNMI